MDCKLARLGPDKEAQVWEFLSTHTRLETLQWIQATHGVSLSGESLSRWQSWYQMHLRMQEIKDVREDLHEWAKQHLPTFPLEEVMERGLSFFMAKAIREGDEAVFAELYKAEIARKRAAKGMVEGALVEAGTEAEMMKKILDAFDAKLQGRA